MDGGKFSFSTSLEYPNPRRFDSVVKFDENGGSQILNQISERSGTLVGINDSDEYSDMKERP